MINKLKAIRMIKTKKFKTSEIFLHYQLRWESDNYTDLILSKHLSYRDYASSCLLLFAPTPFRTTDSLKIVWQLNMRWNEMVEMFASVETRKLKKKHFERHRTVNFYNFVKNVGDEHSGFLVVACRRTPTKDDDDDDDDAVCCFKQCRHRHRCCR